MIQYVDVVPTLIEIARGSAISNLDGSSFLGVLTGETATHNQFVYGVQSWRRDLGALNIRSVREGDWKYIANMNPPEFNHGPRDRDGFYDSWKSKAVQGGNTNPTNKIVLDAHANMLLERFQLRPDEELYNLAEDPHEFSNLALVAAHHSIKIRLRKELIRWMGTQSDPGTDKGIPALFTSEI
jgi:uncharacterized sulfatase